MKAALLWFVVVVTTIASCMGEDNTPTVIYGSSSCKYNDQCPSSKACILGICSDPCESLCGENTHCTTFQHIPACACNEGYTGSPFVKCTLQDKVVTPGTQPLVLSRKKQFDVIRTHKADWIEATVFCLRNNSRLASIDSMEEYEELHNLLNEKGRSEYWTSGSDAGYEGHFIWTSNGKPFSSTSKMWRRGEPSNSGNGENCVEMNNYFSDNPGLNDDSCSSKAYIVCEYYN